MTWFHISITPQAYILNPAVLVFMVWKAVSDVWTHRERQGAWLVFIQSLHWQAAPWLLPGSRSLFSQGPSASLTQTLRSHSHCSCCEQRAHLEGFPTYGKWKTTDPVMGETQDMWKRAIFVQYVEFWGFDLKWNVCISEYLVETRVQIDSSEKNATFIWTVAHYYKKIMSVHPEEMAWPICRNFGGQGV